MNFYVSCVTKALARLVSLNLVRPSLTTPSMDNDVEPLVIGLLKCILGEFKKNTHTHFFNIGSFFISLVMEHPERFPTPTASLSSTPHSTPLPSRMVIHPSDTRPRATTLERIDSVDDESLPPYPGIVNGDLLNGGLPSFSTVNEEEGDRDGPIVTTASIEPLPHLETSQRTPNNNVVRELSHGDFDSTNIETVDGSNQTGTLRSSSLGRDEPFGSSQEDVRGSLVVSDRALQEGVQDDVPREPAPVESLHVDELSEETSALPQHSDHGTGRRASSVEHENVDCPRKDTNTDAARAVFV